MNSHTVNETDTNPATYGTVTRDTPTTSALTVSLLSSNTKKLTVPGDRHHPRRPGFGDVPGHRDQ